MKKSFHLFLICLAWSNFLFAQQDSCSYSVKGIVLDIETKEPLPYITVKIQGEDKFTTTNFEGFFEIKNLCSDNNTLIISCFGFCDSICSNNHQHGKIPHIYLRQNVQKIDVVTIEAKKGREEGTISISQSTIAKEELKRDVTQSLASVLAVEQGVSFASTGTNVQIPIIHGLHGNRILILNNGMKHGFQNWGGDHAPEIDLSSVNNITIIKGASGVKFGPEALGGAIVVESNPMYLKEPFYAEIGTGFQTNGRGLNTGFELGKGFDKFGFYVNGNHTIIGDRHTPDYSLTNSGKQEFSLGFGTHYHLKKWDIKTNYSYINQNLALLRSSVAESGNAFVNAINSEEPSFIKPFSYDIGEPNQLTEHHFAKMEIDWWYSKEGKLTLKAGRQINNRQEFDVRRNADKPIIDLALTTTDLQLEWKHPDWFKLNGTLGLQYFNQDNDNNPGTGTTPFIPNYNINRFSVFLIENKRIEKNLFELGIRLDNESNNVRGRETSQAIFRDEYVISNFTSSLGYVRELNEHSSFRVNFGTAWRIPNMAELYSFGQHGFKTSFGLLRHYTNNNGNLRTDKVLLMDESEVEAEKGYKLIHEYETNINKNTHVVTLYSHYIQNYIYSRPYAVIGTIRGPMPVFIYDQADALFVGTDYTWKREWNKTLSGNFGVSFLYSKNIEKKEALINQPPISTNYMLTWDMNKSKWFNKSKISIKSSYTFSQYFAPQTISPENLINGATVINSNTKIFDFKDAPDGYFLLDLSWSFGWENLTGSVSINNLLNTKYRDYLNEMRYFADEQGRNILFTINYKLNQKNKKE